VLHVARCKCRTQKSPKMRHLGTMVQLCRTISSQRRHLSTIGQKLLNSNNSCTCPDNTVNIGRLEICWRVWGTFKGFRVLAALLHGHSSSGRQPNFAALNRGRHLIYSTGRPSCWALAHISIFCLFLSAMPSIKSTNFGGRYLIQGLLEWDEISNLAAWQ